MERTWVQSRVRLQKKPLRLPHSCIAVPKSILKYYKNIVIFGNIMYAKKSPIYVTLSSPLSFIGGKLLADRTVNNLASALLCAQGLLLRRRSEIKMYYLDNKFECVIPIISSRKDGFTFEVCSAKNM